jgi:hypothetical protein
MRARTGPRHRRQSLSPLQVSTGPKTNVREGIMKRTVSFAAPVDDPMNGRGSVASPGGGPSSLQP